MPEAAAHAGDGIIKMLRNNVQAPAIGNDDAGKGGKTLSDKPAFFIFDGFLCFPDKQAELSDCADKRFPERMGRAAGAAGGGT